MLGFVFKNPKLAYDPDGIFLTFDGINPHEDWCVIREKNLLIVPIFFTVADDCPSNVLLAGILQTSIDDSLACTLVLGRSIVKDKEDFTTDPVMYMSPNQAKKSYKVLRSWMKPFDRDK